MKQFWLKMMLSAVTGIHFNPSCKSNKQAVVEETSQSSRRSRQTTERVPFPQANVKLGAPPTSWKQHWIPMVLHAMTHSTKMSHKKSHMMRALPPVVPRETALFEEYPDDGIATGGRQKGLE